MGLICVGEKFCVFWQCLPERKVWRTHTSSGRQAAMCDCVPPAHLAGLITNNTYSQRLNTHTHALHVCCSKTKHKTVGVYAFQQSDKLFGLKMQKKKKKANCKRRCKNTKMFSSELKCANHSKIISHLYVLTQLTPLTYGIPAQLPSVHFVYTAYYMLHQMTHE